ncbi:MAG: hypothetical protein AAFN92_22130, partial [Bacteroidota bacterium]
MKFLLLVCTLFPTLLLSLDCNWTGHGQDNLWNNPANWDCNQVPGPNDAVTLNNNADPELTGDVTIQSLTTNTCTITGSGDLTVSGLCRMEAGGNFTFAGDLTLNGTFRWRGGTIAGSGNVNANGTTTLDGQSRTLVNRTLRLVAGGEWSRGGFALGDNARIEVPTGQTLTVTSSFTVFDTGDNNGIDLHGSFAGTASSGQIRVPVVLTGAFQVGGNYRIQGGGTFSGGEVILATNVRLALENGTYEMIRAAVSVPLLKFTVPPLPTSRLP